ncbi:MAG TPA: type IV secretion system protein [Steroidobacteraceae bacterium]|jgi:type IV secretion system protein VirB5|nr:type IV secretion system protein [Steroidobacteraceae bacterium]
MKMIRTCLFGLIAIVLMIAAPSARAQWAVIDVSSIAQLMQQVQILEQALNTARGQLAQAEQEYRSITGTRGMQNLLAGTVRNYLPSNSADLMAALSLVNSGNSALSTSIQAAVRANAILSPQQLAALPPTEQARIIAWRSTIAMLQAITGSALSNSSSRFSALQQLITAIGGASDQKAALDLQARIGAESGMLQNEQTKLQSLYQVAQAQQWLDTQQDQEAIIAGHGQFASRFEPVP